MVSEIDLHRGDGRTLHVYDGGAGDDTSLVVFWQHGSPQAGRPPDPLVGGAGARSVRWVAHDRPGYGRSSPQPGRDVAAVADDVAFVADELGIDRFAVMGASGGGPHALACAALLGDRVVGAVSIAGVAPYGTLGDDWFAGMTASNQHSFRAAVAGRAAIQRVLEGSADLDPDLFTPADVAALSGPYGAWLAATGAEGLAGDPEGHVADSLAFVAPWGFDPAGIEAPVLVVHGSADRAVPPAHGAWLARRCPVAERWVCLGDGHLSIFERAGAAVDWLIGHRSRVPG